MSGSRSAPTVNYLALALPLLLVSAGCSGGSSGGGGGQASLAITVQPKDAAVTAPDGATFTVTATGATGYQWRKDGSPIAGATTSTFTVPATDLQTPSAAYSVEVTGANGSVTSTAATLAVQAPRPVWAGDPVARPVRPLTVLPSATVAPAFPQGSFRLGYDEALKNPVWTAYADFKVGTTFPNSDRDFRSDTRLEAPRVESADYGSHGGMFYRTDLSGFDRGHMVTMSDICYRYGTPAGEDATLMSNIVPQVSSLNQGLWVKLEQAVGGSFSGSSFSNGLTATFGRVWVYTGPVFTGTTTWWVPSTETYTTDPSVLPAGTLRIALPTACYKVMVAEPQGSEPKVLAFLMPNVHGLPNDAARLKDYLTSVARIEALTGLDLFPNLPSTVSNGVTWKANVDVRGWGSPFEQAAGPNVAAVSPSWNLTLRAGDAVDFVGAVSPASAGGTVNTATGCTWTFTGGLAPAQGLTATRTFPTPGTYTATFTATDSLGASNTVARVLTVLGDNLPPVINPDPIADQTVLSGASASVGFVLSDDRTPAASLQLEASSSAPALLPDAAIVVSSRVGGVVTLTLTPVAGQTGTATITLRVTDGDGFRTVRSFKLTVTAAAGALLAEGFEGVAKGSYAAADVAFPSGTWNLSDALVGNTTADAKVGAQSIRVRNSGKATMLFDWTKGAQSVSVKHAKYGTDGSSTWSLWYSTNAGAAWTKVGSDITTTSTTLETVTFPMDVTGSVRFEIRKTDGTSARVNLDDFQVVGK